MPQSTELVDVLTCLRRALMEAGYLEAARLPKKGRLQHIFFDAGNVWRYMNHQNNIAEVSAMAPLIYQRFGRRHAAALMLFRTFALNDAVDLQRLKELLGSKVVDDLRKSEILVSTERGYRTRALAAPLEDLICFHDTFSISEREKSTHVFFGRCSVRLARSIAQVRSSGRRFARALDLCTGSGVQALLTSRFAEEVVGVDVNPRAITLAKTNALANGGSNVRFIESNLFEKVEGSFDLITANTPFLLLPSGSNATSGNGGDYGVEIAVRILEGFQQFLRPGGLARLVVSTAWVGRRSILIERLRDVLAGLGYKIQLLPINTYYNRDLYTLYKSLGVRHCTVYLAEVEKAGSDLQIIEKPRALPVTALYTVVTALNRWQGRRAASRETVRSASSLRLFGPEIQAGSDMPAGSTKIEQRKDS